MRDQPQEKISPATKDADRADAEAEHGAPQVPTGVEAEAADRHGGPRTETRANHDDMLDKGANHPGEGRLP